MSDERRLNIGTLLVAAVASAAAAIIVSQFWIAGTPIAAAVTPVIVALVSELLHRPAARVAERLTGEREALDDPDAGPTRVLADPPPPPLAEPGIKVYKPTGARRRIAWGVVALTAVLAFAIGAAALTLPELITGGSVGKREGGTSLFGGDGDGETRNDDPAQEEQPPPVPSEDTAPDEAPEDEEPAETAPEETEPTQTTPPPTTTTEQPAPVP